MSFAMPRLYVSVIFTLALAQSTTSTAQTTLTVPLYGLDATQSIGASVMSTSPNATTYYLGCLESPSDPDACVGFAYSRTLAIGPSTYLLEVSESDLSSTQDCTSSASYAICENFAYSGSNYHTVGVATFPAESITSFKIPVTAGLGKLVEATATSESANSSATARQTGGSPAVSTATASISQGEGVTMTGHATSESSSGAAVARSVGKEVGVVAGACGLGMLWL